MWLAAYFQDWIGRRPRCHGGPDVDRVWCTAGQVVVYVLGTVLPFVQRKEYAVVIAAAGDRDPNV